MENLQRIGPKGFDPLEGLDARLMGKRTMGEHVLKGRVIVHYALPQDHPDAFIADVMPDMKGGPGIYASPSSVDIMSEINSLYEGKIAFEKIWSLKEDLIHIHKENPPKLLPVFCIPTVISDNDTVRRDDCNMIYAGVCSDTKQATDKAMEIISNYMTIYLAQLIVKLGAEDVPSKVNDSFRDYENNKFKARMNPMLTALFYSIDSGIKSLEHQVIADLRKFLLGSTFLPDLVDLVVMARKNDPERMQKTTSSLERMTAIRDLNLDYAYKI